MSRALRGRLPPGSQAPVGRWAVVLAGLALGLIAWPAAGEPAGPTPHPTVVAPAPPLDLAALLATARPGDTITVGPGVYPGPLSIQVPVRLIGQGWPVIQGPRRGSVVTISAPNVTLRGFVLRGSGDRLDTEDAGVTGLAPGLRIEGNRLEDTLFGIYLKAAPGSVVKDNVIYAKDLHIARRGDGIRLWSSGGSLIEGNYVTGSRDVVVWFSPDTTLRGNRIENGRYGLHTMFSDRERLEENVLAGNSVGAFLMYGRGLVLRRNLLIGNRGPSGYGVGLKDVDDVVAEGNRMVGNRVGIYVDNSPRERDATVTFERNLVAYNDIGLTMLPLVRRNTFTGNVFQDNGQQVAVTGGGSVSANQWWRDGKGNFWSDYAGFDADGDGIGDIPYVSQSLFERLMDEYPELRLWQGPAAAALDLAARAFPLFQPQPKMADRHPLMAPPVLPEVPGETGLPRRGSLVASLALLAMSGAVLGAGWHTPWRVGRGQGVMDRVRGRLSAGGDER